jgi:hypothetical protein
MSETKKNKLEYAIEKEYSIKLVKELFDDYKLEYKRIRNPSNQETEEYRDLYFKYMSYCNRRERE